MNHHASTRELWAMLMTFDSTFSADHVPEDTDGSERSVRAAFATRLVKVLEMSAQRHVVLALKRDASLVAELELMYRHTAGIAPSVEVDLHTLATSFAEGVISVLDRDLIQLLNGPKSTLFDCAHGVQVIMGCLVLGRLYAAVDDTKGSQGLLLQVLREILSEKSWWEALERHGPAPIPQTPPPSSCSLAARKRAQTLVSSLPSTSPTRPRRRRSPPSLTVIKDASGLSPETSSRGRRRGRGCASSPQSLQPPQEGHVISAVQGAITKQFDDMVTQSSEFGVSKAADGSVRIIFPIWKQEPKVSETKPWLHDYGTLSQSADRRSSCQF
eukprot:m.261881 g.261881  ORF g.261881 m.261881 type:complete len:328 (-) comp15581_c1_seq1:236-1219(-)